MSSPQTTVARLTTSTNPDKTFEDIVRTLDRAESVARENLKRVSAECDSILAQMFCANSSDQYKLSVEYTLLDVKVRAASEQLTAATNKAKKARDQYNRYCTRISPPAE
jgi:hypothetical protein